AETSRSSAPQEPPAEAPAAAETSESEAARPAETAPVEPAPEPPKAESEKAESAKAEPEKAEPEKAEPEKAEPEKPKVVTRTRRRSASRPAGPPTAAPSGDSGPETSTRTALAEEPIATGQVGAPADTGQVEPGTVDAEPGTSASVTTVEHVPIKKKGSRKR
ncbi:MAG TPA: ribonuclease E/G, partial [Nocardioides sp.]|nr:ribonuclease E/G [Nocardioides sp.]